MQTVIDNSSQPATDSSNLYRSSTSDLQPNVLEITQASGNYFQISNGRKIFDAVGGAAVTNIGHGDNRVQQAIYDQVGAVDYCRSTLFTNKASDELSRQLVGTTDGAMKRAMAVSSGTEANDAMMKLCILCFRSIGQPQRVRFIAREGSYHGSSVSTLTLGHHKRRRAMFQGVLALDGPNISHVSRAHAFGDLRVGESKQQYVRRLAVELEQEFLKVGPETVCAFVAEPIVGSGLGGAVAPPGYFKAVRQAYDKYGALLVMDEVMCGLGRSGTYHAWQHPGIDTAPDLQTVGKTLEGGYLPIAALLIGKQVAEAMEERQEFFVHGATYEDHPVASAAALAVQRIVREENLVENIEISQPWTGELFPSIMRTSYRIRDAGLQLPDAVAEVLGFDGISLFPMQSCADGLEGDIVMLMPAFNVTASDVEAIVEAFAVACESVLGSSGETVGGETTSSAPMRLRL